MHPFHSTPGMPSRTTVSLHPVSKKVQHRLIGASHCEGWDDLWVLLPHLLLDPPLFCVWLASVFKSSLRAPLLSDLFPSSTNTSCIISVVESGCVFPIQTLYGAASPPAPPVPVLPVPYCTFRCCLFLRPLTIWKPSSFSLSIM